MHTYPITFEREQAPSKPTVFSWQAALLLAFFVILLCALSRTLAFSGLRYSLIWPVGGLAFAALRVWSWRGLATVVAAEVAWLLISTPMHSVALALIPVATTLSALSAQVALVQWQRRWPRALLGQRAPLQAQFDTQIDLFRFYAVQTFVAAPIAAVLGAIAYQKTYEYTGGLGNLVAAYWIVQLIGILVYAPLLLLLVKQLNTRQLSIRSKPASVQTGAWIDWHGLALICSVLLLASVLFAAQLNDVAETAMFMLVPVLAYRAVIAQPLASCVNLFVAANAMLAERAIIFSSQNSIAIPSPDSLIKTVFILIASTIVVQLLGAIARDREKAFKALENVAMTDPLTGLLSERGLRLQIDQGQGNAYAFALRVVLLNLPVARGVVDPRAIDQMDINVSHYLSEQFPDSVLSRIGVGRFDVVFAQDNANPTQIAQTVEQDLNQLTWPTIAAPLGVKVGVGVVHTVPAGTSARDWQSALAIAESIARRSIGAARHVAPYEQCKISDLARQQQLDAQVIEALNSGRIVLYAQTIAAAQSEAQSDDAQSQPAVELLTRLQVTPDMLMLPNDFLPVIRRHGLTRRFDAAVTTAAIHWLARLSLHPERMPRYAAINVTAASVEDEQWVLALIANLESSGVDPHRIVVELTESETILDTARTGQVLKLLRERGVRIAVDDFGTGAASYSYLKNLPIDIVKIDGSFVRESINNHFDRSVICSVVEMAKQLNIVTVAEFVETPQVRQFVAQLGVDYVQGYAIDLPSAVN